MAKTHVATVAVAEGMIDVREAVQAARKHSSKFYNGGASLEETELTEDGRYWLITLGFLNVLIPT